MDARGQAILIAGEPVLVYGAGGMPIRRGNAAIVGALVRSTTAGLISTPGSDTALRSPLVSYDGKLA